MGAGAARRARDSRRKRPKRWGHDNGGGDGAARAPDDDHALLRRLANVECKLAAPNDLRLDRRRVVGHVQRRRRQRHRLAVLVHGADLRSARPLALAVALGAFALQIAFRLLAPTLLLARAVLAVAILLRRAAARARRPRGAALGGGDEAAGVTVLVDVLGVAVVVVVHDNGRLRRLLLFRPLRLRGQRRVGGTARLAPLR